MSEGDLPSDHPYDFTSAIIVGELTNTRYVENPAGDEYRRFRYSPPDEEQRRSDTVRLSAAAEVFGEGDGTANLPLSSTPAGNGPGR